MERNGRGTGRQWNGRTLVSWEQARRTISMLNYWFSTLKEKGVSQELKSVKRLDVIFTDLKIMILLSFCFYNLAKIKPIN